MGIFFLISSQSFAVTVVLFNIVSFSCTTAICFFSFSFFMSILRTKSSKVRGYVPVIASGIWSSIILISRLILSSSFLAISKSFSFLFFFMLLFSAICAKMFSSSCNFPIYSAKASYTIGSILSARYCFVLSWGTPCHAFWHLYMAVLLVLRSPVPLIVQ